MERMRCRGIAPPNWALHSCGRLWACQCDVHELVLNGAKIYQGTYQNVIKGKIEILGWAHFVVIPPAAPQGEAGDMDIVSDRAYIYIYIYIHIYTNIYKYIKE